MLQICLQKWSDVKNFFRSKTNIFVVILLSLSLITRIANLEKTAIFFWDPAYDLRQIYQYYQDREMTLIGPISEDGNKVYGSLTYYMLMPFAVLGNFDIASTTYGAAIYGFLVALCLIVLAFRLNRRMVLWMAVLVAIWFPLLETSRWAWNPHFVSLWIVIGILLTQTTHRFLFLIGGLCFGLTIHHHYFGAIASGLYVCAVLLQAYRHKTLSRHWMIGLGFILAILPFVLFDLTHPPGLFITRLLYFNQTSVDGSIFVMVQRILSNFFQVAQYYTHSAVLAVCLMVVLLGMALYDLRHAKAHLVWIGIWVAQIVGVGVVAAAFPHYFLPALVFFLVYLLVPRNGFGRILARCSWAILVVSSFFTVGPQLFTETFTPQVWQPNIQTVRLITDTIATEITKKKLQGVNIAVLGSTDPNTYGWKYRSLLEIKKVQMQTKTEYFTNSYLFVVSQLSEEQLRRDPALEIERFRKEPLRNSWSIPDSNWSVYLFSF